MRRGISKLKIICIGIGNSGCNIIASISSQTLIRIDLIAINTDDSEYILKNYKEIQTLFENADIVVICTGLGGRSGAVLSPIITRIAKELSILTILVVTMPFNFEGKKRLQLAKKSLKTLQEKSNSIILIKNDNQLALIDKTLKMNEVFQLLDITIGDVIHEILSIILRDEENDISLNIKNLQTIIYYQSKAPLNLGLKQIYNSANNLKYDR